MNFVIASHDIFLRGYGQNARRRGIALVRGDVVDLHPELSNRHDEDAVAARNGDGQLVGRVAREHAHLARRLLRDADEGGLSVIASVTSMTIESRRDGRYACPGQTKVNLSLSIVAGPALQRTIGDHPEQ